MVHGQVENLERARAVLVKVLGAKEFPVAGNGAGFAWGEGADLVLHEVPAGTKEHRASGPSASRNREASVQPGAYPPDIREVLESGTLHPELGLRISPLKVKAMAADA